MKKAKILGHMVIVFVCAAATAAGHCVLTKEAILPVRSLRVHAPSEALAVEVRRLAQPVLGVSLYRVDLRELSKRIRQHPRVRSVATRRVLPDTIQIDVRLRQAVAWFSWRAKRYGIDEEGVVFPALQEPSGVEGKRVQPLFPVLESEPRGDRKNPVPIPTVMFDPPTSSGTDHAAARNLARRAVLLLRQHQDHGEPGGPVTHIRVRPLGRLLVTLQQGIEVDVGGADFDAAWRQVKHILPRLSGISQLYIPSTENSSPETGCDRVIIKEEKGVKRTEF